MTDFDLHYDEFTGFRTQCNTIFFRLKTKHIRYEPYMGNPIVDIYDGTMESASLMMNSEEEFDLFFLSISVILRDYYNMYDDYELNWNQWNAILDEADRIVSANSFEEFVAYIEERKNNGICDFSHYFKYRGKRFWENIDLHRKEAADVREWSNLALKSSDKICLAGY